MIAVALARHLASLGLLVFDETGATGDTFIGMMPAAPDTAVAISPAGGNPTNSHDGYDEPLVQIRTRGPAHDPRPAYLRCRDLYDAVVGLHAVTLDFGGPDEVFVIRTVAVQSDPAPIGPDDNNRAEYVQNFAFRTRSLTTHRV